MKKFILIVLVVVLPKLSIACADSEQSKYPINLKIGDKVRTTNDYNKNFRSSGIIGKITNIYAAPTNNVATLDNGKILDTNWLEKYDTEITSKWYVGQSVWDILEGRGVIIKIATGKRYPIVVKLEKDFLVEGVRPNAYTVGGAYIAGQVRRLYPIETKKVNFVLDILFPRKARN